MTTQVPENTVGRDLLNLIESSGIEGYRFVSFFDQSSAPPSQQYIIVRTSGMPGDYLVLNYRARVVFLGAQNASNPEAMQREAMLIVAWLRDNYSNGQIFGLYNYGSVSDLIRTEDGRFAVEFEVSLKTG